MSKILGVLRFITSHPLTRESKLTTLARFFRWQMGSRILKATYLLPFVNQTRLFARTGVHSATGNYYVGLMSFEEMSFLLHFLRKNEIFVDVGANIGAFSVLASGVCQARSYAFEPAKSSYEWMSMNFKINDLEKLIKPFNCAVGSGRDKSIRFVEHDDSVINHVLEVAEEADYVEVPALSLDEALDGVSPTLIKIDVEGFETDVFQGAGKILAHDSLMALIVELHGHGARYGFDESALFKSIIDLGFLPCAYDPFTRCLTQLETVYEKHEGRHEIYCRDLVRVRARLAAAAPFSVLGNTL